MSICPSNGTTQICNLFDEAGTGIGIFVTSTFDPLKAVIGVIFIVVALVGFFAMLTMTIRLIGKRVA